MIGRPWLCAGLAAGIALAAGGAQASYRAEQVGKVVRLTDTGTDTVVSFVPSVGNMAFEMRVKGHNVLYFPFPSIDEYRRGPGGNPFLAPWANRLDELAFYANGRRPPVAPRREEDPHGGDGADRAALPGPGSGAPATGAVQERNFVCFEPMVGITNAMNAAHKGLYQELQSIPPGGQWEESFWIRPRGF